MPRHRWILLVTPVTTVTAHRLLWSVTLRANTGISLLVCSQAELAVDVISGTEDMGANANHMNIGFMALTLNTFCTVPFCYRQADALVFSVILRELRHHSLSALGRQYSTYKPPKHDYNGSDRSDRSMHHCSWCRMSEAIFQLKSAEYRLCPPINRLLVLMWYTSMRYFRSLSTDVWVSSSSFFSADLSGTLMLTRCFLLEKNPATGILTLSTQTCSNDTRLPISHRLAAIWQHLQDINPLANIACTEYDNNRRQHQFHLYISSGVANVNKAWIASLSGSNS